MCPSAETVELPELTTTVLPSNGQLVAEETDALLKASLAAVRADLAETPAWSGAPTPTDDFLLMFLRAEVFKPALAAKRYRKFWEMKVFLWGEDKAGLPVKAEDAIPALHRECFQLIPDGRDIEGRQVLFVDPGNTDKSLDRKQRLRAMWYVILAGLEDVETQRRGLCFIVCQKTVTSAQMDRSFLKMGISSIQGALPVRVGSINICYPPTFFRILWAIVSIVMHKRVKKRVRVLPGTDAKVAEALGYIVDAKHLPPPMGAKTTNFPRWLEERMKAES